MLTVTDKALELLAGVVDRAQASEGAAVRIVARPERWGIEMDQMQPGDEAFEHDDRTVLILDADVSESLQDMTLDADTTPEGLKLRLR
jgi:hypothetical protein